MRRLLPFRAATARRATASFTLAFTNGCGAGFKNLGEGFQFAEFDGAISIGVDSFEVFFHCSRQFFGADLAIFVEILLFKNLSLIHI